jgi:hypothetical protein
MSIEGGPARRFTSALGALSVAWLCATVVLTSLTGCPGTLSDPALFEDSGASHAACPNVVTTVFAGRCAISGCHTAADRAGSLDLESPDLYQRLAGQRASGGPGMLIDPNGNPQDSILYLKLTPNPPFGSQMPLVGEKLDPATLACVGDWIMAEGRHVDAGAADATPDTASSSDTSMSNDSAPDDVVTAADDAGADDAADDSSSPKDAGVEDSDADRKD